MERHEYQDTTGRDTAGAGSIQGEGDYRSAREYREDVKEFLEHADVARAAREAEPRDPREARELEQAEAAGRSRVRVGSRRTRDAGRSVQRAVRDRPVVAIVIAGAVGCLAGWASHRGRRSTA